MGPGETTCWTVVQAAASGDAGQRAAFAARYLDVVRAYLGARWRGQPRIADLDDAVQEVFVECFRPGGALTAAEPGRPGGFRAFLFGVARNVALRFETRRARRTAREGGPPEALAAAADAPGDHFSRVFDRAWAEMIMRAAAERQVAHAGGDPGARQRVEILRLRFHDGLPVREIATRLAADPVDVHRAYARARREFRRALLEELAFHRPDAPEAVERECLELLGLLQSE